MAIKRYFATADNTITNAFKEDLSTRGTGSNMGQADILEVFSIYAQQSSTSTEAARFLVQFPVLEEIKVDRDNGILPNSGQVSFYLKLHNATHPHTLPKNYKLDILAVSASWEEGNGLDMEGYTDETYDKIGSNWINANNTFTSASATITALSKTAGEANTRVLSVSDSDGNTVAFSIDNSLTTSTATKIAFANANSNANQFATNIAAAINAANTAETLNVTATATDATVTLTQKAEGFAGNSAAAIVGTSVTDSVVTIVKQFSGGSGKWTTAGGDYHASPAFTQSFDKGDEDLEVNVTSLVEQWLSSTKVNYGFGIKLSASFEASSSTNPAGAVFSYYTKKFFARSSEFFFDRPVLEARWDSTRKDNRGNFYFSSSLAPAIDNLNTLYLYNYIRGNLRDIAGDSNARPVLRLYTSSGSVPEGNAINFRNSSNNVVSFLSASRDSKGVYKASFSVTGGAVTTARPYLQDVWSMSGSELHTGSVIIPKKYSFSNYNPNSKHVVTIKNLKPRYTTGQTERFRLFVRKKNWSPNIFTVAKSAPANLMIESASYQLTRLSDNKIVIPYNTGSDSATMLSYDVSGNYFDLDLDMLEAGYTYGLKFSFYEDSVSSYREQPYTFKIRVEQDEY